MGTRSGNRRLELGDMGVTIGMIRLNAPPASGQPAGFPFFTIWRRGTPPSPGDTWRSSRPEEYLRTCMSIFKRIASVFARPDHEIMAGSIGDRLSRAFGHLNKAEQQEAIQELRGLSQDVSAFVERGSTSELKRAVEHWALHGTMRGESATIVATFFADNDSIRKLAALVREGDASHGVGLIWLQEAFNEAGLIMGPTIHDQETQSAAGEVMQRALDEVQGKAKGPFEPGARDRRRPLAGNRGGDRTPGKARAGVWRISGTGRG